MTHKVRMTIAAVLVALALLGTGWVASPVPPVLAGGASGENGG